MIGYQRASHGRYKCDFCDHKVYKTWGGVTNHLDDRHDHEMALARRDAEIERLKNLPPKVVEKVVYKEKEKPKYWQIQPGGGVYCETCKTVQIGAGIPHGQTLEETPHSDCGNNTLKLVLAVK